VQNIDTLYDAVAGKVQRMKTETFLALMDAQGIPFSKVNTVAEFLASPEAEHTGSYSDLEDPEYGSLRHLSHPAKFERSPAAIKRRAPKLGEHNEEILKKLKTLR
jgi:crotonobetainyl-CoA:carnitine CoA-transferase CaiB-like acyl-CoA transferase